MKKAPELTTKAFPSNVKLSPDDARTVVATISTSAVDREGEVLVPMGMRSKDYESNSIVFYNHSYADFCAEAEEKLPIGKVTDIKRTDTEVVAKIRFADRPENYPTDKTWLPDTLFSLYKQGVLNGWSVGFQPLERRPATQRDIEKFGAGCKLVTSKWDLFELSAAPLQCNQEAVTVAVSKGLVKRDIADKIFKPGQPDGDGLLGADQAFKSLAKDSKTREPLARSYTQYSVSGDGFSPTGDEELAAKLDSEAYRIVPTMWGIRFAKMRPQTDELYRFKNSTMEEVLTEIDKFWDLKGDYQKLGLLHNRGIMLYGPPGNGKTSLMNQVAEQVTGRGDVVFYAKSISALIEGLGAFREVEPDRKAVVVLEDADEYVGWQERDFLQLLDGEKSVDGVLYLGSTNYINAFPPRLLRPGRFDKRIFVGPPPYEGRLAYLKAKLQKMEKPEEIERLAKSADGLSFGDLRELVTAVYALKEPADTVVARLKANANRKSVAFAALAKKSMADTEPPADEATEKIVEQTIEIDRVDEPEAEDAETTGDSPEPETKKAPEQLPGRHVVRSMEPEPVDVPVVKRVHRILIDDQQTTDAKNVKYVSRQIGKMRGRIYAD